MELDLSTTVRDLQRWYASARRESLQLSRTLTSGDLVALLKRHRDRRYSDALFSIIVTCPIATPEVLQAALTASDDASSVQSAIATRRDVPRSLLLHLRKSQYRSVRHHAELALISDKIATGVPARTIKELLAKYPGDGGIDLGVRAVIAASVKTPQRLLQRLTDDDADFIAAAARKTLRRLASGKSVSSRSRKL
jgi:hypothetical protein